MIFSKLIPKGYTYNFEEYLFNTKVHRLTQSVDGWASFYLLNERKFSVEASFHCFIEKRQAFSSYRATFGGLDFNQKLSLKHLTGFIASIDGWLNDNNITSIKIITAPQNYNNEKFIALFQALMDSGYSISKSEVTSSLMVDENNFDEIIHKSERKKIKRSKSAGFYFKSESFTSYESIYDLIALCRKERDADLSLSKMDLGKIIDQIPKEFQFFAIYDQKKIIAAAICLRISSEILYVFYGGHLKIYDKLSPAVMLYEGIYDYCKSEYISLLDFGSSHSQSGTNIKLLDFKRYLGASQGLKVTFTKNFHG